MGQILAFGDSITYGLWDSRVGWPARLRQKIDERQVNNQKERDDLVYQLGVPSETSAGLKARFTKELTARQRAGEQPLILLACGANDAAFLVATQKQQVEIADYVSNMRIIIEQAQAASPHIFCLTILPLVEPWYAKTSKTKIRINKIFEQYNAALKELCTEVHVQLIDVHALFTERKVEALMNEDGIHPNDAGHELIADFIWQQLEPLLK